MINSKTLHKILISLFVVVFAYQLIVRIGYDPDKDITWGVAFSKPYAESLDLNWMKLYDEIIDDLRPQAIRLSVYWDDVEVKKDNYDFSDYDWMMSRARNNDVVLVVGQRLPRWPECHRPGWLGFLSQEDQNQELLDWIKIVVDRYKTYDNIIMWQVENEPFLTLFGECEKVNEKLLKQEIELVKSLDDRPILVTDSGELSTWRKSSRVGDYLGTTVYRKVYNLYFGYWGYWWMPASFYRFKARINGKSWDKMLISELQTESWFPSGSALDTPLEEQYKSMDAQKFGESIKYAQKIGFSQSYLWGVEWWWWLKEKHGDGKMWEAAREVFFNE